MKGNRPYFDALRLHSWNEKKGRLRSAEHLEIREAFRRGPTIGHPICSNGGGQKDHRGSSAAGDGPQKSWGGNLLMRGGRWRPIAGSGIKEIMYPSARRPNLYRKLQAACSRHSATSRKKKKGNVPGKKPGGIPTKKHTRGGGVVINREVRAGKGERGHGLYTL